MASQCEVCGKGVQTGYSRQPFAFAHQAEMETEYPESARAQRERNPFDDECLHELHEGQ